MNDRRIKTEEEYQNSLKWLVSKAEQLEHPLLDEQAREKLMKQYDFVSDRILEYQRRPDREPKYSEEPQDELTDWLDDDD